VRICKVCDIEKSLDVFVLDKGYRLHTCRECMNKKRNARLKERGFKNRRDYNLKAKYKIDIKQYNSILESQGGGCAICHSKEPGGKHDTVFHIDHDHSCCPSKVTCGKCIRGLLCHNCNTMLGLAKDSPQILEGAIRFLNSKPLLIDEQR
jgi:hypothetical protein